MTKPVEPEHAAAQLASQGIAATLERGEESARFATQVLGNSARPFARLGFEEEPSGYAAALRKYAP